MAYRFLLVSLKINGILGEITISERREKLEEMTIGNNLGDAYATTAFAIHYSTRGEKNYLTAKSMPRICFVLASYPGAYAWIITE